MNAVRSHAKGCFIELDKLAVHDDQVQWETNYRWNFAVQENVKRHGFTFPEVNVLLLLDWVNDTGEENIILDLEVSDFAALAEHVCGSIRVVGGQSARAEIRKLLASKNKDLRQHLDVLASDPILMPCEGEHAMSVNVLCADAIESRQLVFVRMKKPIMAFMDSVVAAQYCLFCFGPVSQEAACIAEGCAFAGVMSDYNLEVVIKAAASAEEVLLGFAEHIEDLVVLPHVHMHSSIRKTNLAYSSPGTPTTHAFRRQHGAGRGGNGARRNRADAEDVLEEVLELCIQDFDHAEDEAQAGHDIHRETHRHEHHDEEPGSDGEPQPYSFVDEGHTESFVQMIAVDTDGPHAGVKRTIARWHNALQQDCVLDPAMMAAAHAANHMKFKLFRREDSFGRPDGILGGGAGLEPGGGFRRKSFARSHSTPSFHLSGVEGERGSSPPPPPPPPASPLAPSASPASTNGGGTKKTQKKSSLDDETSCGAYTDDDLSPDVDTASDVRTMRRSGSGSLSFVSSPSSQSPPPPLQVAPSPPVEWSLPHLPHESAPLMAEAVEQLQGDGQIFLDVQAEDVAGLYEAAALRLRDRLEALGLTKAVGELGVQKLLSFLDSGGQTLPELPQGGFSTPVVVVYDPKTSKKRGGTALRMSSSSSVGTTGGGGAGGFSGSSSGGGAPMLGRRRSLAGRHPGRHGSSIADDLDERRRTSAEDLTMPSTWGLDGSSDGGGGGGISPKPANMSYADVSRRKARARAEAESMLFMETDHGGCGTWHEESMEVLCVHSAVLPPGCSVCALIRLEEAVEQDRLGDGYPSIRWLYVILGAFHPSEVDRNEGMARAVALFFSSDDVYDACDRAKTTKEVIDAMRSFMRHACVVPRARPLTNLRRISLSAQSMAQDRLVAAKRMWDNIKGLKRRPMTSGQVEKRVKKELQLAQKMTHSSPLTRLRATIQKYSLPLLVGVLVALVFSNTAPEDYEYVIGSNHHGDHFELTPGFQLLGHPVTIHFLVNDIFMVFFFGLAAKEITEAFLPGGALSPVEKALSPLLGTIGGVVGPIAVYIACAVIFYESGSFSHMKCDHDDGHVVDDDGSGGGGGGSGGDEHFHHRQEQRQERRRGLMSGGDGGGGGGGGGDDHGDDAACQDVDLAMIIQGWGVPTATDISLAWMVSVLVFGLGHNAIGFLLLLAVVDDGIGLIIIAVFYPDPDNPVQGQWLPLIPAGMLVAYGLRRLEVERWQWYVAVAGPISWFGFLLSHVHPALALVPIVPFLPAHNGHHHHHHHHQQQQQHQHHHHHHDGEDVDGAGGDGEAASPGNPPGSDGGGAFSDNIELAHMSGADQLDGGLLATVICEETDSEMTSPESDSSHTTGRVSGTTHAGAPATTEADDERVAFHQIVGEDKLGGGLLGLNIAEPPSEPPKSGGNSLDRPPADGSSSHLHPTLHQFEHDLKLFVDCGMFFFAFANAGVQISTPGGVTISIILALIVGKTVGIAGFAIGGDLCGIKLPDGVTYSDVVMVGFIASMGLTVALFVAGEAFTDPELQGEAKMGALISGLVGPVALLINRYLRNPRRDEHLTEVEFDSHVMRHTEEIDENVVREGLVRILKKRHAEYEALEKLKKKRSFRGAASFLGSFSG